MTPASEPSTSAFLTAKGSQEKSMVTVHPLDRMTDPMAVASVI